MERLLRASAKGMVEDFRTLDDRLARGDFKGTAGETEVPGDLITMFYKIYMFVDLIKRDQSFIGPLKELKPAEKVTHILDSIRAELGDLLASIQDEPAAGADKVGSDAPDCANDVAGSASDTSNESTETIPDAPDEPTDAVCCPADEVAGTLEDAPECPGHE